MTIIPIAVQYIIVVYFIFSSLCIVTPSFRNAKLGEIDFLFNFFPLKDSHQNFIDCS